MIMAFPALLLALGTMANAYEMVPRWGHAAVFIPSPPSVLVHGGKTGSTYTSANSADLIRLSLSEPFDTPSWQLVDTTAPAYAWHTMSWLNDSILLFGGDGGTSTPLPAGTDSAWILSNETFTQQSSTWANQPPRMIHHAAVDGMIIGGQRNDGSGRILSDVYAFDSVFAPMPSLPVGLAHHSAARLSNGTVVVVGGIMVSPVTGNAALASITLYALDPAATQWRTIATESGPDPRRGQVVMVDGDRLVLMGGADLALGVPRSDMWQLDLGSMVWTQLPDSENTPSARFDHSAVSIGSSQYLVFGGFGATADTYIYNVATHTWATSYSPASPSPPSPSGGSGSSGPSASPGTPNGAPPPSSTPASIGSITTGHGPTDPTASPSGGPNPEGELSQGLSKGAQAGMAIGIIAGLSVLALFLFLCIRRKRQTKEDGNDWDEKAVVGLGLGAMASGWSQQPYQALRNDIPARKPTRRVGNGIKLVGARSPPVTNPRVDMLVDEDSRRFADWQVDKRTRKDWVPAHALDSDSDESLLLRRISGGPVPTPLATSVVDPFDDSRSIDIGTFSHGPGLHQLPPHEPTDFSDLLAVPSQYDSLPRSERSRESTNGSYFQSDIEEGVVYHASRGHPRIASIVSPDPEEGQPVRRSQSFFQRMTAGGITGLLNRRDTGVRDLRVRDTQPEPALWPIASREPTHPHPPTAWTSQKHTKGPSVSSLTSAKSMRDMVVVQRETTQGSEGDVGVMDEDESMEVDNFPPAPVERVRPISTIRAVGGSVSPPVVEPITPPRININPVSPSPPSGSPLPKAIISHRRPVKDMVSSINKRASVQSFGSVELSPNPNTALSPASQYSASPGATPNLSTPKRGTSWEVRRRESLVVANPGPRRG